MNARVRVLSGAIGLTSECVARLPRATVERLATAGGHAEWALRPHKRHRLRVNLAHAVGLHADDPAVARLAHEVVVVGARRAADTLWAFARPEAARTQLRIEPRAALECLGTLPHGAILASAHVGAFEFVLACGLGRERAVSVLADTNVTARALARRRLAAGIDLIPADGPPRAAVRRLQSGGIVVVLADLHRAGMRGFTVRFLDSQAVLPAGPATLARLTGAPIVPFAVLPIAPRSYRLVLERPLPPPARRDRAGERELVQKLADAISATLRAHPQHWDAVDAIPWRAATG